MPLTMTAEAQHSPESIPWHRIFRIAVGFFYAAWLIKIHFFGLFFYAGTQATLQIGPFPSLMANTWWAIAFYMLPLATAPLLLGRLTRRRALAISASFFIGSTGCLLHQHFFNDATFAVLFWGSLWLLWLSLNSNKPTISLATHSKQLATTTVALIFFGGFLGKMTPTYWSGEIFFELYFQQKQHPPYTWLNAWFSDSTIVVMARWFSRLAIFGEAAVWLSPLVLTYRRWAWLVVIVATTMVIISTPWLFSVMGGILGITIANMNWPPPPTAGDN